MGEPQAKLTLAERLRQEAHEIALDHFGAKATPAQIAEVYDCEMAMFTFHCATGDDLDCTCGAHGNLGGARPSNIGPEDFA